MIHHLIHFLYMGGYAFYVWGAYASMLLLLGLPWYTAWRRWKQSKRDISPS